MEFAVHNTYENGPLAAWGSDNDASTYYTDDRTDAVETCARMLSKDHPHWQILKRAELGDNWKRQPVAERDAETLASALVLA